MSARPAPTATVTSQPDVVEAIGRLSVFLGSNLWLISFYVDISVTFIVDIQSRVNVVWVECGFLDCLRIYL